MVLQISSDLREIDYAINTVFPQFSLWADPREKQELRAVDGATRDDNLFTSPETGPGYDLHPNSHVSFKHYFLNQCIRHYRKIAWGVRQVSTGRCYSYPIVDASCTNSHADRGTIVHVWVHTKADFFGGSEYVVYRR